MINRKMIEEAKSKAQTKANVALASIKASFLSKVASAPLPCFCIPQGPLRNTISNAALLAQQTSPLQFDLVFKKFHSAERSLISHSSVLDSYKVDFLRSFADLQNFHQFASDRVVRIVSQMKSLTVVAVSALQHHLKNGLLRDESHWEGGGGSIGAIPEIDLAPVEEERAELLRMRPNWNL